MIKKYLIKFNDDSYGNCDLVNIARILERFDEAVVFTSEDAIYFKRFDEGSLTVLVDKRNVGALKLDRNILKRLEIKIKLERIDEISKLAEEIENMNVEEFVKKMR